MPTGLPTATWSVSSTSIESPSAPPSPSRARAWLGWMAISCANSKLGGYRCTFITSRRRRRGIVNATKGSSAAEIFKREHICTKKKKKKKKKKRKEDNLASQMSVRLPESYARGAPRDCKTGQHSAPKSSDTAKKTGTEHQKHLFLYHHHRPCCQTTMGCLAARAWKNKLCSSSWCRSSKCALRPRR